MGTGKVRRRSPSLIPAALGALIVMTFVFAVGRPNVFTDTRDYMIHGARFYQALRRTFLGEHEPVPATPTEQAAWEKAHWQMHFDHSNMGARSPYYGIFLYTLAHRGTLWLVAAAQSFICAWVIVLLWRSMAPAAPGWTYYTLMAALAAGTSLPWVASFAMPDIFAGVLVACIALLLLYRAELRRWELWGVIALTGASIAFHNSHLPLALTLIVVGVVLGRMLRGETASLKRYALIVGGAVAAAVAAGWIYGEAIQLKTGDEFRRPPFIAARVIADGPGRAYLRSSCAKGAPWVMCRFKSLPLDDSDMILWSAKTKDGVFNRSNYEDRVGMEKQESEFVLATVAFDPAGQLIAALKNWGTQLVNFQVDDPLRKPMVFLVHDYWGKTNLVGLLRGAGPCGAFGEKCEPQVKIDDLATIDGVIVGLSLVAFLIALGQPGALRAAWRSAFTWSEPTCRATAAGLLILAAIILNAAICGILAGPFPRYQARLIWLLPAIGMLLPLALVPEAVWARSRLRLAAAFRPAWAGVQPAVAGAQGLWSRLDPAFLRFFAVGAIGFVIDAAILHGLTGLAGMNPYLAQAIAFPIAVLATWTLNRIWTFPGADAAGKLKQAAVYFGVQCAGFATNYVIYAGVLMSVPALRHWLVVPLAMGAAAGLGVTFLGAKHLAFRTRSTAALPAASAAAADTPAA
jgi:putative flippase GtrA